MLRDAFMTPTAGPEEVWEQFGMSKVRSIKARGYQGGSAIDNASVLNAAILNAAVLNAAVLNAAVLNAAVLNAPVLSSLVQRPEAYADPCLEAQCVEAQCLEMTAGGVQARFARDASLRGVLSLGNSSGTICGRAAPYG